MPGGPDLILTVTRSGVRAAIPAGFPETMLCMPVRHLTMPVPQIMGFLWGRNPAGPCIRKQDRAMRYKIVRKQPNSKMCLVCGLQNDFGLYTSFYELENGELLAIFKPRKEHQSYPGRLHGGIVSTILDETIGRAIMISHADRFWGVTVEITIRFKQPVPLDHELRVIGRITRDAKKIFEGTGEILLADGSVAAEAHGKYMKLPLEQIADFKAEEQNWKVRNMPEDPEFVDIEKK